MTTPAPSDWYLVVPLPEEPGDLLGSTQIWGSAQVFVVNAADMDAAAAVAHEQGAPRSAVLPVAHYRGGARADG